MINMIHVGLMLLMSVVAQEEAAKTEVAQDETPKVEAAAVVEAAPVAAQPDVAVTPVAEAAAEAKLNVYPAQINLGSGLDRQSLVVQRVRPDGITEDLSTTCSIRIEGPHAKFENGFVLPVSDGDATLIIEHEMKVVEVPVKVTGAANIPPVSFQNDVMPVFSKTGCNAGSCHGARGKDGFNLSLYGFDPKGDHHRLTREMMGRRVNLAVPDNCLLTNKATGAVPHSGGSLMSRESEYYQTIVRWLEAGATQDVGKVPTVDKIELYPPAAVLNGPESQQKMSVVATYSDGATRDVTNLAYFSTNNDNSASISQLGVVTASNRGEAFVMARFDTHTVGSDFIVLPKDVQFQWPDTIKPQNYIDEKIHDKLRKLRIIPSEICTDAEFIRRSSLDICGIVPTSEQVQSFVADVDPEKRSKYIDSLLERKEFSEIWLMKWSELLQVRSINNQVSYKSTLLYFDWLKERIANNVPVDQMVREILGSTGGTFSNPATNYFEIERDKLKTAENVAQVFMGTRIQCAQCHNHPFDRWTMDDYYSFAAFFAKVNRKQAEDPRERIIFNGGGETRHPVTKQVMTPKFLGGDTPTIKGNDRRTPLAQWLTAPENPWFARNLSNIVWAHFFGRGIVHEIDDVRVSNPAVNPQLLDEMAAKFVAYKFDFKMLVRDICNSRTYQLSTRKNETNASDETNFSRSSLRRVRAEILLDVITQITETRDKFRGLPLGARAVQIADGNTSTYFLNTFGRAKRETVCSCEVKMEPNLSQALHLINGDTVQNKIKQGGVIKKLIDAKKTDEEILNEMYLRCFARTPTEAETTSLKATIADNENRQQTLEDIFWALLNSREFVFNH